jgi:hypothetical protein
MRELTNFSLYKNIRKKRKKLVKREGVLNTNILHSPNTLYLTKSLTGLILFSLIQPTEGMEIGTPEPLCRIWTIILDINLMMYMMSDLSRSNNQTKPIIPIKSSQNNNTHENKNGNKNANENKNINNNKNESGKKNENKNESKQKQKQKKKTKM